ncbi:hypothetical protein M758_2G013400 [Ceratodon purpureus]|nr:hypothetical protein M758_2G013400 [Ceratodon purpureus]
MVGRSEGSNGSASLHAPLLGEYVVDGEREGARANGEVVVPVDDDDRQGYERSASGLGGGQGEEMEVNYDTPELATQSRTTFEQIHDHVRQRSSDQPRTGLHSEMSMSRSKHRRHAVRNPIHKKSFVARAAYSFKTDTLNFLYNVLIGLYMWPKWSWDSMKSNKSLTVLSIKQGFCAGLASILCVVHFPKPYTQLSSIALWAVITTDLLYEANIGLSISKGFNRVLGTLAAGLLGFSLNQVGPEFGPAYPYFVVFCVTMGGIVFRYLKGIPPLKDQWGYAFTVATMAFHIFIISAYLDPERWTLPMLRFSMILLGFAVASLVNIAIQPIYAGDALHKLVAKNFDTAATVFERCVEEYNKETKLDHVPDILSGRSVDDRIHQSYHEIVMSDSDIDKLLSAVHWEPSHGKFFKNYPWEMYDDITDYLRYTLYDVIALDLCLRANIQAPKCLRDIFAPEMATIASECATVLRTLGDSIKNMKKFPSENIMKRAEEAAVALQFKIYLNTNVLLGNSSAEGLNPPSSPFANKDQGSGNWAESNDIPDDYFRNRSTDEDKLSREPSQPINIDSSGGDQESSEHTESSSLVGSPGWSTGGSPQGGILRGRSGQVKRLVPPLETLTEGVPSIHVNIPKPSLEQPGQEQGERTTPRKRSLAWQQTFMHRKSSLGPHWDGTLERISALSLVKFASLLIEVVTKMRYVVDCVDELGEQARFEKCDQS